MCETCGCDGEDAPRITLEPGRPVPLEQVPLEQVPLGHVTLERKVLARNDDLAGLNRTWFAERGIVALNMMSSPARARRRCWSAPSPT